MGVTDEVPVGFENIRLDLSVDGDLDEDTQAALRKYIEQYCVVYQTLETPPAVETTWTFQ